MAATSDMVVCPRCSAPFSCGIASERCWCADVTLNPVTRADLAKFYDGCLCPACLQEIEDVRPPRPSVRAFLKSQLKRQYGRG